MSDTQEAAQGGRRDTRIVEEHHIAGAHGEDEIEAIDERVNGVRDGVDVLSQGATVLQDYVGARMHEFEQTLKSQRSALASIVASQEQTDDVVEGVVGAMELLHSIVFDRAEGMPWSSQAVSPDLELIAR